MEVIRKMVTALFLFLFFMFGLYAIVLQLGMLMVTNF